MIAAFSLWLVARERRREGRASLALWLPITWMLILGSRPVSMWLGLEGSGGTDLEGSPLDANIFLLLIVGALLVLATRRIDWRDLLGRNRWVFIYFGYLGISVLWSDYSDIAFKRWVKDFGSLLMVLVILTEEEPIRATRMAYFRCAYLLIPASVLLVSCFPYVGTFYDPWNGTPVCVGVTTNKNMLGMTVFVSGQFLMWALLELRKSGGVTATKRDVVAHALLVLMVLYLLVKAKSSTALGCSVHGFGILVTMRSSFVIRRAYRLGTYAVGVCLALLLLNAAFDLKGLVFKTLERDETLTGRIDIWQAVLKEDINPLIGAGHYSFWLNPERVERLSEGYYYKLNEAHNGYIEVYLNSGLIGLFCLLLVVVSGARGIKREAMAGATSAALRSALLIGTVAYGMTEAVFRFSLISLTLLLVSIDRPASRRSYSEVGDFGAYPSPAK